MNSTKPLLHISIYYRGKFKNNLKKELYAYTKRILSNPYEPSVEIRLDWFNVQQKKKVQQVLIYNTVNTYRTKYKFTCAKGLYTMVVILISLARQQLYENIPYSRPDDLMTISITPSDIHDRTNAEYIFQWSIGQ